VEYKAFENGWNRRKHETKYDLAESV
jgi:hypothetical protein